MTDNEIRCLSCNSVCGHGNDIPTPNRCQDCPPIRCDYCAYMDNPHDPCPCWVSTDGDSPADIKAMFAAMGLSVRTVKEES